MYPKPWTDQPFAMYDNYGVVLMGNCLCLVFQDGMDRKEIIFAYAGMEWDFPLSWYGKGNPI